ncbi:MAG: TatD family hydrolase [Gammaproteobacteria bacterium]|nr:TatD family hydrolase [Gammaproteobacteria bacterium]
MLIDSHCHIDCLQGADDSNVVNDYLNQAAEKGVNEFLCVSIDWETWPRVIKIAEAHQNVYASIGVHPNHREGYEPTVDDLLEKAKLENIIAIGETGLDYYYNKGDMSWQQDRFRTHITAAKQCQKPIIIHTRDARDDTIAIMQAENARDAGGVMHCFTETWDMAKAAMDMGFYISFSGIVTFKSAKELQEVAKKVPLDRMLVETDSPYLAPVPHRGKQNQPAYTRYVAEFIAELRGVPFEEIAAQTTQNFRTLFKTPIQ